MNKKNLSYQSKTSEALVEHLLKYNEFKLQAPTGSGKTMMMGLSIEKIITNPRFNLISTTFIFVAPSVGKLDYQGYEKITNYLNKGWLKGFKTHYIGTSGGKTKKSQYLENINKFEANNVYFLGWALFSKNSNLSKIDSENNNIIRVLQNTIDSNIKVILIIDEAHREVKNKGESKKLIIHHMKPYKTIQISATLDDPNYIVSLDDVRDEMAIKKKVIIDMAKPSDNNIDRPNEINDLIKSALAKQEEIKQNYIRRGINGNPLILIQIPDKSKNIEGISQTMDEYYITQTKLSLEKQGLKEGMNYAFWLHNNKTVTNKDEIIDKNSRFDVLIFKQAIATGWDIPRANILIRLREPVVPKFDIQTLGRILRNPRFKYYNSHLIDNAFVFTRDEKYVDKIKDQSFVSHKKEKAKVHLSPSGKNSDIQINSIYYSKPIIFEDIVNELYELLIKEEEITKHLAQLTIEPSIYLPPIEIDAINILDDDIKTGRKLTAETQGNKYSRQLQLDVDNNLQEDLFIIYIKYMSLFHSKNIDFQSIDMFINYLSNKKKFKKKELYLKLISDSAQSTINKHFNNKNIFEYINDIKNTIIKKNSNIAQKKYNLPLNFEYNQDIVNDTQWDEVNSYHMQIKKWDSKIEETVYQICLSRITSHLSNFNSIYDKNSKNVHIFRNSINNQSYYVEYYDKYDKLLKFFPDFILIDDLNKKAYILEVKGRTAIGQNIDQNSEYKFKSIWDNRKLINNKYIVQSYRVEPINNNDKFNLFNWNDEKTSLKTFISNIFKN